MSWRARHEPRHPVDDRRIGRSALQAALLHHRDAGALEHRIHAESADEDPPPGARIGGQPEECQGQPEAELAEEVGMSRPGPEALVHDLTRLPRAPELMHLTVGNKLEDD